MEKGCLLFLEGVYALFPVDPLLVAADLVPYDFRMPTGAEHLLEPGGSDPFVQGVRRRLGAQLWGADQDVWQVACSGGFERPTF